MSNTEFKKHNKCRFCSSKNLTKVIDLGKMPLAGGFLTSKKDFRKEKKYPLELLFCKNCFLVQTSISINPDTLFKKYFYFSSAINTLVLHFQSIAKNLKKTLRRNSFVVEIGCNDGEFIKALQSNGYKALGVDPAANVVKPLIRQGLPIINDYFSEKLAKKIVKKYGRADAVYSFHSLAHITDMNDVIRGVKIVLSPSGYLAFEVQYIGDLLEGLQYDMIYHEHLHYYSLLALKNFFHSHGMEIYDVQSSSVRAGSITYFVQNLNTGKRKITKALGNLERNEKKLKLNTPLPYLKFNKSILKTKTDLFKLVTKLKKEGKLVAGYGASGRGTAISNYAGLNVNFLKFVVDDSPAKQNKFMPGTHNPILSPKELVNQNADYAVLFAWPFIKEVKKRNKNYLKHGGRFILPLPKVEVTK